LCVHILGGERHCGDGGMKIYSALLRRLFATIASPGLHGTVSATLNTRDLDVSSYGNRRSCQGDVRDQTQPHSRLLSAWHRVVARSLPYPSTIPRPPGLGSRLQLRKE